MDVANVELLRKSGYKVRVIHRRFVPFYYAGEELYSRYEAGLNGLAWRPNPRGGLTTVLVTTPNGEHKVGSSACSDNDNYDHKLGVTLALQRALGIRPNVEFNNDFQRNVVNYFEQDILDVE